ncbi:hypothetical protein AAFN86_03415 [Roseomonas sp. CAU 1739]|uniref:hypothetical protein n=1 Tax=Roseomonas sp. CAU 1739 TaxID=3140364 RepID=UPI00325B794B
MAKSYPWEYHPHLTEDRIVAVACLIVDGRQAAVERFDEEAGDNGWTLGCCAFQYGRARILRAVDDGTHDWLGVIDRSLQLIFTIGEVPVRIYRGEAEEPTIRTMRQSRNELRQLGFSFDDRDEGHDLAYRFAIETDIDGSVLAVKFVGLRGETATLNWDVPIAAGLRSGAVGRPATETVELDAPTIGVREREIKTGD